VGMVGIGLSPTRSWQGVTKVFSHTSCPRILAQDLCVYVDEQAVT